MKAAGFSRRIRNQLSFQRLFLIILLLAVILRFLFLDLKLYHHDEAIHAWFSFRLLTTGAYQYDPVYHGPLLYYVTAGMFGLLGDSDIVGRLVPSLLGVLILPLIYAIYRLGYLDGRQTLVAALFVAVSPEMVYFSRFLRNDIFILFLTLLLIVSFLYYLERAHPIYAVCAGAAAGLGIASKENMPIILAIFGSYLIYLVVTGGIRLPDRWKRDFFAGIVVAAGIVLILYSSFGMHPETALDWWLRAIEHWTGIQGQQRLGGPWFFYLLLLILYELPILILGFYGALQFIIDERVSSPHLRKYLRKIPAIREKLSIHQLVERCRHQARCRSAIPVLEKNREFTRFCIYWMLLSLGVYAYIGEKVPWLILHMLMPLIFVAMYRMTNRKAIFAIVSSLLLVACTWHVAFVPVDVNEPIVQVQNSEDLRGVMEMIDVSDHVAIATKSYWPLPWYYRGDASDKLTYFSRRVEPDQLMEGDYDLVLAHDADSYGELPGYEKQTTRLSYWFSYDGVRSRLPAYYLLRDGPSGSMNIDVFRKVT